MEGIFGGGIACLIGVVLVLGFVFLANAVKIVPEYQRLVVFRLGRSVGPKGPGLILLIPVIDRAVKVDLREQVREIPHQTAITKDNAGISVDFIWYYKVLDPTESVLQVGNFEVAAQGAGRTLQIGHRSEEAVELGAAADGELTGVDAATGAADRFGIEARGVVAAGEGNRCQPGQETQGGE